MCRLLKSYTLSLVKEAWLLWERTRIFALKRKAVIIRNTDILKTDEQTDRKSKETMI